MRGEPVVLGVAGGSGAGKTTVVRRIVQGVEADGGEVVVIHHDAYYRDFSHLPPEERDRVNFDHPEALETTLLVEHLHDLMGGRAVEIPVYDFTTHTRTDETRRVSPADAVIVDGILVLADPGLRELTEIKIFVDTDPDIRFIRRLRRDMEERDRSLDSVIRQYTRTVRPMHVEFVEPSKRYADVIIPEGGHNRVAVQMVLDTVRSTVRERGRAEE
ncbi:MAG: uridine kinase [Gemmatimonadetes bacterium]|nr:uridine kinase [Gemmatimonadota bacterium]NIR76908.1 uridine kinase [Gemmatimonadota bacterium]NIT85437.1 uridine kinase [Gemmatimonadota bacterium]NIU29254.1 uridine kinase [Gemmatimonadota bacterium]NIU34336.1 uridine kinase [Gemmatimonadota bacterium]